jgi:quaternary ammonium compound-resistance protein SugE
MMGFFMVLATDGHRYTQMEREEKKICSLRKRPIREKCISIFLFVYFERFTLNMLTKILMHWFYLVLAGLLEIGWAIGLKYTVGITRLWPSAGTAAAMVASFFLLSLSLKAIPIGTAYAVWTGIGAAGTALLGMMYFNEPREVARIVCLVMIVAGTVGLKFFPGKAG